MKKSVFPFFIAVLILTNFVSCNNKTAGGVSIDISKEKSQIVSILDSFNIAAANAQYDKYFSYFTSNATFNGTDATENWNKETFMQWARPYFDKKTTWHFTSIKRNIYFGEQQGIAWFDELLNTQMKICRGSGVLVKQNNEWKIQQYVLSMTVPNENSDEIIKIKTTIEDSLINTVSKK